MLVYLRGGGDLASGVAVRLQRAGLRVLITELPQPQMVRRLVSFAEAVYRGWITVEGITARRTGHLDEALALAGQGFIPVLVDPQAATLQALAAYPDPSRPAVLVDGRMTKRPPETGLEISPLVIGLGPGFIAGINCHAAIETNRGHFLGRVIWQGPPEADTGVPESVRLHGAERVLRSPAGGTLVTHAEIGDHLEPGQPVAEVAGHTVLAPFRGVLRGLLHPGLQVRQGAKIGDVDPRDDPRYCTLVSDKALAIGGAVLEAILSRPDLRCRLWE